MKSYTIQTPVYEGPLEALIDLIEKRKLCINDIALAHVADDFIAYVQSLESMHATYPLHETSEFLVIASTLLLIKSRSLLPNLSLTESEQSDMTDLELRLSLLQHYKTCAQALSTFQASASYLFSPRQNRSFRDEVRFSPHESITVQALVQALHTALQSMPQQEVRPQVSVKKIISLEEMIGTLNERVSYALKTSFKEFSGYGKKEKVDVIVSFLALLELVKRGVITARQHEHFADITLETDSVSVPRYT